MNDLVRTTSQPHGFNAWWDNASGKASDLLNESMPYLALLGHPETLTAQIAGPEVVQTVSWLNKFGPYGREAAVAVAVGAGVAVGAKLCYDHWVSATPTSLDPNRSEPATTTWQNRQLPFHSHTPDFAYQADPNQQRNSDTAPRPLTLDAEQREVQQATAQAQPQRGEAAQQAVEPSASPPASDPALNNVIQSLAEKGAFTKLPPFQLNLNRYQLDLVVDFTLDLPGDVIFTGAESINDINGKPVHLPEDVVLRQRELMRTLFDAFMPRDVLAAWMHKHFQGTEFLHSDRLEQAYDEVLDETRPELHPYGNKKLEGKVAFFDLSSPLRRTNNHVQFITEEDAKINEIQALNPLLLLSGAVFNAAFLDYLDGLEAAVHQSDALTPDQKERALFDIKELSGQFETSYSLIISRVIPAIAAAHYARLMAERGPEDDVHHLVGKLTGTDVEQGFRFLMQSKAFTQSVDTEDASYTHVCAALPQLRAGNEPKMACSGLQAVFSRLSNLAEAGDAKVAELLHRATSRHAPDAARGPSRP